MLYFLFVYEWEVLTQSLQLHILWCFIRCWANKLIFDTFDLLIAEECERWRGSSGF